MSRQFPVIVEQGGVGDAHGNHTPIAAHNVPFDVQAFAKALEFQRALGLANAVALLVVAEIKNLVAGPAYRPTGWHPGHLLQRFVEHLYPVLAIEDHYPVAGVGDDGIQTTLLVDDLLIQPRVLHGDGRLVGKTGQYLAIVGGEGRSLGAKDVDHPRQRVADDQGQGHHLAQGYSQRSRDQSQFHLQVRDGPAGQVCPLQAIGDVGEQGREQVGELRWQTVAVIARLISSKYSRCRT